MIEEPDDGSTRLFTMRALVDGRTSDRKRRLFAVACLRRFAGQLADPRSARALATAARYAEGLATEEERDAAETAAFEAYAELREGRLGGETLLPWSFANEQLCRAAALVTSLGVYYAEDVADYARRALASTAGGYAAEQAEEAEQCRLLREIVGPPGLAPLDPAWPAANDGAALALARLADGGAYDLLPLLGDALEDAGCADAALLSHCRGGGDHAPGCWAVDLVLGKG